MKVIFLVVLFFNAIFTHQLMAAEIEVIIKKFKFIPAEVTIHKGDKIIWVNKEKRQYHSVWFEQSGDPEPGYFFPGESYTRQFEKTGSFPYRCGPHPEMTGIVHVKN
jgi:plastocyanin